MSYGGSSGGSGTLHGASDVALNSPANGDVLRYNSSTQKWSNGAIVSGGGTSPFISVLDYGATGNGSTDDTAAINSAIAAVPNGGVIVFPGNRTYVSSGNHNLPHNVYITAYGALITHTGNNSCFRFVPGGNFSLDSRSGAVGLHIQSNGGSSTVGVEAGNQFGFTLRDSNIANVNVGILLNNTQYWTEGTLIDGVKVDNANAGIRFARNGGTDSFGYTRIHNFGVNVNGGGAGFDMGSSNVGSPEIYIYNSDIDLTAWLQGNNSTGVLVGAHCNFTLSRVFIVGETNASGTSTVNNQGGNFTGMGFASVAAASSQFTGSGNTQVS